MLFLLLLFLLLKIKINKLYISLDFFVFKAQKNNKIKVFFVLNDFYLDDLIKQFNDF